MTIQPLRILASICVLGLLYASGGSQDRWEVDNPHDDFTGSKAVRATLTAEWGYRGHNDKERLTKLTAINETNFQQVDLRPWDTLFRVVSVKEATIKKMVVTFLVLGTEKYFRSRNGVSQVKFKFDNDQITSVDSSSRFVVLEESPKISIGWHAFTIHDPSLINHFLSNILSKKETLMVRFYSGQVMPTNWTASFKLAGAAEMLKEHFAEHLPTPNG